MLPLRAVGSLASCWIVLLVGCDPKEEERPPVADFGGYSGQNPGVAQGGDGGDGDDTPDGDGVLMVTVDEFVDHTFATTTSYSGEALVRVFSQDQDTNVSATGPSTGVEVSGVDISGERWIYTEAADVTTVYYPTLHSLDIGSGEIHASLVPASLLEEIFFSFQSQTNINENAGHIALTVVDGSGTPLSGVEVSYNSGGGDVTYREGNAWFNLGEATGASGQIFIANEQAAGFPGQRSRLIFTGSIDEEASVRVASGTVTVLTIVVP